MARRTLAQDTVRRLFDYRRDGKLIRRTVVGRHCRWKVGTIAEHLSAWGYFTTSVEGVQHRVARIVYVWHHGAIADDLVIDHRNGITTDDRIANLRAITVAENLWNQRKWRSQGVNKRSDNGKWRAYITVRGKQITVGSFETEIEARAARDAAKAKHHMIDGEMATCSR